MDIARRIIGKRVLSLRNLPFSIDTVDRLRSALGESVVPASAKVELVTRESGRFNGRAILEYDKETALEAALAAVRSSELEGRAIKAKVVVVPRPAIDFDEDELGSWVHELEEQRMPSLDEVRSRLLDNDQYGHIKSMNLPGLGGTGDDEKKIEPPVPEDDKPAVLGRWAETIVRVDRVQKVVPGGTIMKYRALVVVGNLMGAGGYGHGKGASPQEAVARASRAAKNDLHFVDRYMNCALTHDVRGSHNNCTVDIFATQPGFGMKGGRLGRAILTQLGFSSFTIKAYGRRTPASNVYATFNALANLQSVEDIARKRGRRILEIEHAIRNGRTYS